MSNAAFKQNYARLLAKAGNKAELVVRKTAIELQSMMIARSPVDTGRFKGNWQAAIGTVNTDTSAAAGSDALGRTKTVLVGWKPGQTILLTNSMPYSIKLERGSSQQAPSGVVRLTVQNYSEALTRAVAELK
jgi:hypothetical protein